MIRLLHVYYPIRSVALFCGEAVVVCASFLLAAFLRFGPDSYLVLDFENGFLKILGVTVLALLTGYYFDLYSPERMNSDHELFFRILIVLGTLSFAISLLSYIFPDFILGRGTYPLGTVFLAFALVGWRQAYALVMRSSRLRERVYVLGEGPRASKLVNALRSRSDLAMNVVGWSGALGAGDMSREELGEKLLTLVNKERIHRVIVALSDRRGRMPTRELLHLRLHGVRVEDAGALLERASGKIEVDSLHPSALIFADGFNLNAGARLMRGALSKVIALTTLLIVSPVLPIVVLAVKLTSPGPVIYKQRRVGRYGETFNVYKFRTMRQNAEVGEAKWACKDDPRVTPVGRFLRKTRLDELPQLWNVLRGDMAFVGPRPERPEFVRMLEEQIPYYQLRHMVRPGLTGWAQVCYQYGASVEDSKEKLQYDLYYIKHASVALDLMIMFETTKTILLRRGGR